MENITDLCWKGILNSVFKMSWILFFVRKLKKKHNRILIIIFKNLKMYFFMENITDLCWNGNLIGIF